MNFLKILLLSSVFLFTNCSLVNDKLISRSEKKNENIGDDNSEEQEQEKEQDIVMERVYIEDEKDISSQEGLQGDIKNQGNIEDYPNLADVPSTVPPTAILPAKVAVLSPLNLNASVIELPLYV